MSQETVPRPKGNIRKDKDAKEISPIAFEAVRRIDALFEIERELNGQDPAARLAARQARSAPLVEDLERWVRGERALLSKHAKVAKAIDYLLSPDHWPGFTRFLQDGRVCWSPASRSPCRTSSRRCCGASTCR